MFHHANSSTTAAVTTIPTPLVLVGKLFFPRLMGAPPGSFVNRLRSDAAGLLGSGGMTATIFLATSVFTDFSFTQAFAGCSVGSLETTTFVPPAPPPPPPPFESPPPFPPPFPPPLSPLEEATAWDYESPSPPPPPAPPPRVADVTPPSIELLGDAYVEVLELESYVELGATVTDAGYGYLGQASVAVADPFGSAAGYGSTLGW